MTNDKAVNENANVEKIIQCPGGGDRIPDVRERAELQSDGIELTFAFTDAFTRVVTLTDADAKAGKKRCPAVDERK